MLAKYFIHYFATTGMFLEIGIVMLFLKIKI